MAKKKKAKKVAKKATKKPAARAKGSSVDPLFAEMLNVAQAEFGPDRVYQLSDHRKLFFGLPLPSLALRWMMDSNIMPLGRIVGLAGPAKCMKSAFATEMMRWIDVCGGGSVRVDTEGGKVGPMLMEQILGERAAASIRHHMMLVHSAEEGQERINKTFAAFCKRVPDKDVLFGMVVDSLTGAVLGETSDKIEEEGFHARGYEGAVRAMMFTNTFGHLSPRLASWPILFTFVNHQKIKLEQKGQFQVKEPYMPGGVAQHYYVAFYFLFNRILRDSKSLVAESREIRAIRIAMHSSSFGVDNRSIDINFNSWLDGEGKRRISFDWGAATTKFLFDQYMAGPKNAVKEILFINRHEAGNKGYRYSCERLLGKNEQITATELGRMIDSDPQLMTELQTAMDIQQYDTWNGLVCLPSDPSNTPTEEAVQAAAEQEEPQEPQTPQAPEPQDPAETAATPDGELDLKALGID